MTGPIIGFWLPAAEYLEQLVAIAHIWEGWRLASGRDRGAAARVSGVVQPPAGAATRAA